MPVGKYCPQCQGGHFIDRGVKSEFENNVSSTRNLTDFGTRTTWSDQRIRAETLLVSSSMCRVRSIANKVQINEGKLNECGIKSVSKPLKNRNVVRPILVGHDKFFEAFTWTSQKCFALKRADIKTMGCVKTEFECQGKKRKKSVICKELVTSSNSCNSNITLGEKSFACDFVGCGKLFSRNEELTRHKRIHSGERPHVCEICRKCFGRKDHLIKHRKTHLKPSERRVYYCPIDKCDRRYTRSDALTRHQWTVHNIKGRCGRTL